jgi:hypothetical protein
MKKNVLKRSLKGLAIFFGVMVLVLCIHIYIVTRPNPDRKALARIDLHQNMSAQDATIITNWLYKQKGIDHVYCAPASEATIFSFYPAQTTADKICNDFKADLNYTKAQRFIPSASATAGSCPVMATSITYKVYNFFKHIF